jgi:hypothetical protein
VPNPLIRVVHLAFRMMAGLDGNPIHSTMKPIATLLTFVPLFPVSAFAAVLYSDDFNRADSRNINGSASGIVNNTGTVFGAGGAYTQPWLDPNNKAPIHGLQDAVGTNGGGSQITGNQLQLATGVGTSNAFVNHNFTNPVIASAGNFTVTLDVTGYTQTDYRFGGGFAVGMSLSDAGSAADAFDNAPGRMTGAFNDASTIGLAVPGVVVSDFWVALRGNSTLVWGGSGGVIMGATGLAAKTGTISVNFSLADFNAGSSVGYEVFYNAVSKGTGSFTWSGTNENYIGLDARDSTGTNLDNFSVSYVPEPSVSLLAFGGLLAGLRRRR